ncbi:hypothetical protein UCREL1_4801 [Eutypa lata UCREL1]|uniref:CorA-like transporter domain-containing protein n=1 Tax=Eutypa lata (strain UCR-EL1) TaxID=1287681 RepID=M7SUI9_EUTLA|nr:hypothetical protein UCREL1_4801 [Eutypa lata UCREL1]
MRQTAVYHSLDISNGKSFWVTVKANGLIRNRIAEASSSSSGPLSIVPSDLQSSLRNALATHLIMLQWCTDGWRCHGNGDASPIKTCTSEFPQGKPPPSGLVASGLVSVPLTQEPETIDQGREEQLDQTTKRLQVLQDFSLKDLQNLNFTSSKLREAKMVMSMNINILKELREHYWNLLETASVPSTIAEPRGSDMDSFQRRVKLFERCLESECLRADTLMGQLEDGKNLYDMLLQAQKTEIEKLFAMNSHDSSQRMELSSKRMENVTASMHDIAKTTERDTSSMHIITLFTLIFLPGTFLGYTDIRGGRRGE